MKILKRGYGKNLFTILFLFSLIIILTSNSFNSYASETHQIKLNLNKQTMESLKNSMYIDFNKQHFGNKIENTLENQSFINFSFKFSEIDGDSKHIVIEGNGVVKVLDDTFPISFKDILRKDTLDTGEVIYYGPITGNIVSKKGNTPIIIGLEYVPLSNMANATVSVGDLGNGMGLLVFGDSFMTQSMWNTIQK